METTGLTLKAPLPRTASLPRTTARPLDARGAAVSTATEARGAVGKISAPKLDPETRQIERFRSAQSTLAAPLMFQFVGSIAGGIAAGVTGGLFRFSRGAAVIGSITRAPFAALQDLRWNNLLELPGNYMKAISEEAKSAKSVAAERWQEPAAKSAESLHRQAKKYSDVITKEAKPHLARVGRAIDVVAGTDPALKGGVDRLIDLRLGGITKRHAKAMAKAEQSFSQEMPGFFQKIGNFITRRQPATVALAADHPVAPLLNDLVKAKALRGNAQIDHFKGMGVKAAEIAEKLAADKLVASKAKDKAALTLIDQAMQRLGHVTGHLEKVGMSAGAVHLYESAKGGSLKTVLKAGLQAASRAPVMGTLLGASVVAGTVATVLSHNHESKESKATYQRILADLGGDQASPVLKAVHKAYRKDGMTRLGKSAMSMVADAGMLIPGVGGAEQMLMTAPQVATMFIADNSMLNAYASIEAQQAGKANFQPSDMQGFYRELIADLVESAAQHDGVLNRLDIALAEDMQKKNMSASETVKLLHDTPRFNRYATEILTKLKTADAAKAAEPATPVAQAAATPVMQTAATASPVASTKHVDGVIRQRMQEASAQQIRG